MACISISIGTLHNRLKQCLDDVTDRRYAEDSSKQLSMPKMEQLLHALPDMALFVEVARTGSFRQAAARL